MIKYMSRRSLLRYVIILSLAPYSLADGANRNDVGSDSFKNATIIEKKSQRGANYTNFLLGISDFDVRDFFLSFKNLPTDSSLIGGRVGGFEQRPSAVDCAERTRIQLDGETQLHSGMIEQGAKDPFERDILVGTVIWRSDCEATSRGIAYRLQGAITIPSAAMGEALFEFEDEQDTIAFGRLEINQVKVLKSGHLISSAPRLRMTNSSSGVKLSEHFAYDKVAGTLKIESNDIPISHQKNWHPLDSHWLDFDVQRGSKRYVLTVELPTMRAKK